VQIQLLRRATLLAAAIPLLCVGSLRAQNSGKKDQNQSKPLRAGPLEPAGALKSFKLQPGFRIELVAAEPLVRDPVAISFDESGRMYVVEYPEFNKYSFKNEFKGSGAVKLLEDTNRDGRFDKSTLFLDKVDFPTAVICYDGGVFVGAAPDLLFCKDTNGDGRADERRVVLTGFARDFAGGGLLNSFRWGLDNRIHVATSFAGGNVRRADRPGDKPVSVRGRGLIWDPRSRSFEATSGGGQHGMGMDDWGRKFLCSNVNPMQLLMYDGRYIARNPFFAPPRAAVTINAAGRLMKLHRISPLEPWRIERSRMIAASSRDDEEGSRPGGLFTSASGITVYRGDAWPQAYRGNLFVGEVANNLVYRAKLEANGLGLLARRADRDSEFLASTDTWFRPVQFANAPDGNLYVVDMYRELIEGAAFVPPRLLKELDPRSGTDRGRIYRIVFVGGNSAPSKSNEPLPHKLATTNELIELLEHPNGWHRETATRLIYEQQDRRGVNRLRQLATTSKSPTARVHALYALHGLSRLEPDVILPRLADSHPEVRVHAVRLSESMARDSPKIHAKLLSLVDDGDLRVRYQVAFSLGAFPGLDSYRALAILLERDGANPWVRAAVQSSLLQGAGDVFVALSANQQFRSSDHGEKMLASLASQIGAQNRKDEIALLLKGLQSVPKQESEVRRAITVGLFKNASREVRQRFSDAGASKLSGLLSELLRVARKEAVDEQRRTVDRIEAIGTLALADFRDAQIQAVFGSLLELRQPQPIQAAALETLRKFNHPKVPKMLIASWSRLSPQLRSRATEALFSRTQWTIDALDAIETGKIARGDIAVSRLSLLRDHRDQRIQDRVGRLLSKAALPRRRDVVVAYQAALRKMGDAGRGKMVFKRVCSACHKSPAGGDAVGADLAGIGNKNRDSLLLSILDPNREVKPKFVNYVLVTDDGRTITGMIVEEIANSISIGRSDGISTTILRIHIDTLRSTGLSFMPEGLEKQVDLDAMTDLLAYLATFK